MVRIIFKDSGEIWELYEGDRLTSHRVKRIIDEMRWFRKYSHECYSASSMAIIKVNDDIVGFVDVSDYFVSWCKVYSDGTMVDTERRFIIHG